MSIPVIVQLVLALHIQQQMWVGECTTCVT